MLTHDEACLCDVIIKEPTPIRFGLHEIPLVMEAARFLNLGYPWTAADMADVMTPILNVRQAIHGEPVDNDQAKASRRERRAMLALHAEGMTIAEVMAKTGMTFPKWRATFVASTSSPLASWTPAQWVALEDRFRSETVTDTYEQIAAQYGVTLSVIREALIRLGLNKYFLANQESRQHRLSTEAREAMRQGIRDGMSRGSILSMLKRDYNESCDPSLISKTRVRMTERGEM